MKKKLITSLLAFCFVVPCLLVLSACVGDAGPKADEVWNGQIADVSPIVENVVTIDSAEELAGLAQSVNSGITYEGVTVKLACDMDLQDKEWTPIGYGTSNSYSTLEAGHYFKGTFDGQNHTIYNLKITEFVGGSMTNQTATTGVGLFGHLFDATVKNLTVDGAEVEGNHFVAVIAGFTCGTKLDNVHVKNALVTCEYLDAEESGDKAAAVVAFVTNSITSSAAVTNCSAKDSLINADRDAGQLIGCFGESTFSSETTSTHSENSQVGVEVYYNETGEGYSEKSGTNINNQIIGRDTTIVD